MERMDTSSSDESGIRASPCGDVGKLPNRETCMPKPTAPPANMETQRVDTSTETDEAEPMCKPMAKASQSKTKHVASRKKKGCQS